MSLGSPFHICCMLLHTVTAHRCMCTMFETLQRPQKIPYSWGVPESRGSGRVAGLLGITHNSPFGSEDGMVFRLGKWVIICFNDAVAGSYVSGEKVQNSFLKWSRNGFSNSPRHRVYGTGTHPWKELVKGETLAPSHFTWPSSGV